MAAETDQVLTPQAEIPQEREPEVPHEREHEPGVPRFMYLIYLVILGFGVYYFATQLTPPAAQATPSPAAAPTPQAGPLTLPADADLQGGNTDNGKNLFARQACSACHVLEKGQPPTIAPNLSNIGNRAATRKPDRTAAQYIWESMMTPNAFLTPGFGAGIMPQDYRQRLSAQDAKDVIAYLLTLKSGQD